MEDGPYARPRSAKRPFESPPARSAKRSSRDSTTHQQEQQHHQRRDDSLEASLGETTFRILCPEEKAGGVIGKGGSIISHIRHDTGARVCINEATRGRDERIVTISCLDVPPPSAPFHTNNSSGSGGVGDFDESWISRSQEALFRVHARICDGEEASGKSITTRLLVPSTQVGCLLGKGGVVMQKLRQESRAQIRILPRDLVPSFLSASEDVVQISGELSAVRRAVRLVSTRLRDNPPRDRSHKVQRVAAYSPHANSNPSSDGNLPQRNPFPGSFHDGITPDERHSLSFGRGPWPSSGIEGPVSSVPDRDVHFNSAMPSSAGEELVYRILCPDNKIGCVIGKNGSTIKRICEESGAKIKITDSVPGTDDRIIIVSSDNVPEGVASPAEEALLRIQPLIVDIGLDNDSVITTGLLVPASHASCLIGKGGSVISEMRRSSGANIRILPREDLPPCALQTDELVQIVGNISAAHEALIQISARLRMNLCSEGPPPSSVRSLSGSNIDSFTGRIGFESMSPGRAYAPSALYQGSGYPPRNFQPTSHPPQPLLRQLDSKPQWDQHGAQLPLNAQGGAPTVGRPNNSFITRTTCEVVIAQHAIPTILGESRNGLAVIEQISGAKLNMVDPRQSKVVIEISGSSEQIHAARCLIEAALRNDRPLFQ